VLRPVVEDAFGRIERVMDALSGGSPREVLTVGVVGTFAIGFLIERLADFRQQHPFVDLRLLTNNNKVDLWTESLDFAIRFGAGAWHGTQADLLLRAPVTALCSPATAEGLRHPADLEKCTLLRSYRDQDWPSWLAAAGVPQLSARGPVFDASTLMVQAAILGEGVALAPAAMFQRDLHLGALVQPFAITVDVGGYWLTRLISKPVTRAMAAFQAWLTTACQGLSP